MLNKTSSYTSTFRILKQRSLWGILDGLNMELRELKAKKSFFENRLVLLHQIILPLKNNWLILCAPKLQLLHKFWKKCIVLVRKCLSKWFTQQFKWLACTFPQEWKLKACGIEMEVGTNITIPFRGSLLLLLGKHQFEAIGFGQNLKGTCLGNRDWVQTFPYNNIRLQWPDTPKMHN